MLRARAHFCRWCLPLLLLVTCSLGACGRFGVRLLQSARPIDGGTPIDAGTYRGNDAGPLEDASAGSTTPACAASLSDADGDGVPDCEDRCPMDPEKSTPGLCDCGVADSDRDGDRTPDCLDGCPEDSKKTAAGACGCGTQATDRDADGVPDCIDACLPTDSTDMVCNSVDDDCDGSVDEGYIAPATACGVGACARNGVLACDQGSPTDTCLAGQAVAGDDDSTCDGIDSDCDGRVDELYAGRTSACGTGACASTGTTSCVLGQEQDSCVALPAAQFDDATAPGNGIDDDCDGQVDEDIPPCDTTSFLYVAGAYTNLPLPGRCRSVTVRLWGAGGGGAEISRRNGSTAGHGGAGGPGGYATASAVITGPLDLYVGDAAANSCVDEGSVPGISTYNGGMGAAGPGSNGADGVVSGGGAGANPVRGSAGGGGYYGGGSGGGGYATLDGGNGGGGGAASVFLIAGARVAVAGGGGGGGGGASHTGDGNGGIGGSGCGGAGSRDGSYGGGGGGGGVCQGDVTQAGTGTNPAFASSIPAGVASGGAMSCGKGGGGYAIVTFSP